MRCPSCGARNIERAGWCTQCFASLTVLSDPRAAPGEAIAAPAGPLAPADAPRPVVADAVVADAVAGDIRQRDGEVEWCCRRCRGWVPLAVASCTTCGDARHGFGEPAAPGPRRGVAAGTAIAGSLLLPGLGHVLLGAVGSGVARILLWLLWAGAGIGSLTGGGGPETSGAGLVTGAILLLGAAVLWVASAVDAAALRSDAGRQLLAGRRFVVLVAAVTGGLLLTAMVAALGALG